MMLRALPSAAAGLSLLCNAAALPSVDLETCTNALDLRQGCATASSIAAGAPRRGPPT